MGSCTADESKRKATAADQLSATVANLSGSLDNAKLVIPVSLVQRLGALMNEITMIIYMAFHKRSAQDIKSAARECHTAQKAMINFTIHRGR